jgi:hypothetical protein
VKLENMLGKINSECSDLHGEFLLLGFTTILSWHTDAERGHPPHRSRDNAPAKMEIRTSWSS